MSKMVAGFVMGWADGAWVKRDDSTGPMSTGGSPCRVEYLSDATVWKDKMDALKYRHACDGPWSIFVLELNAIADIITPAEKAEASGDKEFAEFQRLAKKYGVTGTGECPFIVAWVGKCKKPPAIGELYCEKHKGEKCWKCGVQATKECAHAGQFVCGMPECDKHSHHG